MRVAARTIQPGMCIKGYGRVQSCMERCAVNPTNEVWGETVLIFMTEGGSLVRLPHEMVKVIPDE